MNDDIQCEEYYTEESILDKCHCCGQPLPNAHTKFWQCDECDKLEEEYYEKVVQPKYIRTF